MPSSTLDLFEDYRPDTPFTDRVVCLLGTFRQSSRALQQKLREMGADYRPSTRPSRNVHYCLVGENPPADQMDYLATLAYHGYRPRVLRQNDLDDILSGHYAGYRVPAEFCKDLRLTRSHYELSHVDYSLGMNPLYTRELYLSPDTLTPQYSLYRMLGERGIYANAYIDETTDVLLVSDRTLEDITEGRSNPVVEYIQQTYNRSRAQSYRYVMTTESEILAFLEKGKN
ncbi:MAG: hypothetical protein K5945_05510 [Bacteroidaceae bacterium]|nr:hypothetical protein [Bacteroidaceae bacterium]